MSRKWISFIRRPWRLRYELLIVLGALIEFWALAIKFGVYFFTAVQFAGHYLLVIISLGLVGYCMYELWRMVSKGKTNRW